MRFIYFECTEGTKRRFYRITAQAGLFGPVLIREWGRIGTLGQIMVHHCEDTSTLEAAWLEHMNTRLRRGYKVISAYGCPPFWLTPPNTQTSKRLNVIPRRRLTRLDLTFDRFSTTLQQ